MFKKMEAGFRVCFGRYELYEARNKVSNPSKIIYK
jgi:hypothetical protein